MSKGIGNGGITTDGLVFSVDAFNLKSYIPPYIVATVSSNTGSSYSNWALNRVYDNALQPVVFAVPGNYVYNWSNYIVDAGGSLPLSMTGGAFPETFTVSNATYDSVSNSTILYPDFTANYVTMSYPCVVSAYYGSNWIKISGQDKSGIFNTYLGFTNPLIFSMTGGSSPIAVISITGSSYSGFALDKSAISITGYAVTAWNNILLNGTVSLSLSGGAIPEIYDINNVFYDYNTNQTILYPNLPGGLVTMTHSCVMDNSIWSVWVIKIPNENLAGIFNFYLANNAYSLSFGLTGGAIPETYIANGAYYDGTSTYLYDNSLTGTLYSDHTDFSVLVPDITSTLYTDNTIFTYSTANYPEIYAVNAAFFDGTDTYLYSYYGGMTYSAHNSFTILVPEMVGLQYNDNVANFSYDQIVTPQTALYDMSKRNFNCTLNGGVGFDGRSFIFEGIDDYIDVGNLGSSFSSFSLDLWFNSSSIINYRNIIDFNGGNTMLRIEQYTAPGYLAPWVNLGGSNGNARVSVSLNGLGDGSFGIGGDCPGNILPNVWYNLIVTYQNGGFATPLTNAFIFDGLAMVRTTDFNITQYIIIIQNANIASTWNNYIAAAGGTLNTTIYESTGTHSESYPVYLAVNENANTFLIPRSDPSIGQTVSTPILIDNVHFGFNCIKISIQRWDLLFGSLFNAWSSLTMSLVSGTYSENYVVDSVAYSGGITYIYDSAMIGTTYNVYTSFTAEFPKFGLDYTYPYDRIVGSTISGNFCSMYLNGDKFLDQWNIVNGFPGYISNMRIGDGYDYSSRRFQGKIPIVSIYDRAITPEEALTNYEELKWRFNI